MASKVRIPAATIPIVDAAGSVTTPWYQYLRSEWNTTGGDNDEVESTQNRDMFDSTLQASAINDLQDRINALEHAAFPFNKFIEYNAVTVITDYNANAYDFINAKNSAIITMPEPDVNDVVIVRNGDGSKITVESTKNINGHRTVEIMQKNTSLVMQYFIDSDEWLIR